jgi:GST-like protein
MTIAMIELHFWPTPNGWKITIMLEETGLPYELKPVNIGRGEQFTPEFLAISPNNRMPAIVDRDPAGGGAPISVFESGAILMYLGDKTGRFFPKELRARVEVTEWVMWQMGGLGPMLGQAFHFARYAPEKIAYAIDRYKREAERLLGVLDKRLAGREYVCGEYSIADIASFPWVRSGGEPLGIDDAAYPNVAAWRARMLARPAVAKALEVGAELRQPTMDDQAKKILFGHDPKKT